MMLIIRTYWVVQVVKSLLLKFVEQLHSVEQFDLSTLVTLTIFSDSITLNRIGVVALRCRASRVERHATSSGDAT
jgi:hypothetical protein